MFSYAIGKCLFIGKLLHMPGTTSGSTGTVTTPTFWPTMTTRYSVVHKTIYNSRCNQVLIDTLISNKSQDK